MALILLVLLVLVLVSVFFVHYRVADPQLVSGVRIGCARYPLTPIAAAAACFLSFALIYDYVEGPRYVRILALLAVSIPMSYSVAAFAGAWGRSTTLSAAAALLVCSALGWWAFSYQDAVFAQLIVLYALAACALLSVCQSPGARDNLRFWEENQKLAFAVFAAALAGGVLDFGIGAILMSLHYLFDIEISHRPYLAAAAVCSFAAPVVVFLGITARTSSLVRSPALFLGLSVVKDYVVIPLALIYNLILYAYGARILLTMQLPKGMVGWMVSSYAGAGLLIWLASYLEEARVTAVARLFFRRYFLLLVPLLLLLTVAVSERIGQYGFTESRYFLLLFLVWMALLALCYVRRPAASLRIMPLTLLALLAFSALTPWSAFSVSRRSQESRWRAYLAQLRRSGTDAKTEVELARICDYLAGRHGIDNLARSLPSGGGAAAPKSCADLFLQLGITYHAPYHYPDADSYSVWSPIPPGPDDIRGYEYLYRNFAPSLNGPIDERYRVTGDFEQLRVLQQEQPVAEIPFAGAVLARLEELRTEGIPLNGVPRERMTFEFDTPRAKAKLILDSFQARRESGRLRLAYFSGTLLLTIKDENG